MNKDIQIFAIGRSASWAKKLTAEVSELRIAQLEERDFEDGEHKIRPLESVRGKTVFVVHSLYSDEEQSVNDKLCRLLFLIAALKDASANTVNVVTPYFAYARKDRQTKSRDPITMRYLAELIESVGADRVIALDIHNLAAFQNAFRIPTVHLEANVLFAPLIADLVKEESIAIVSPDAGGLKRAEKFRALLSELLQKDVSRAFLEKKRSEGEVTGGEEIIGNVKGRTAIIIDDIISSGTTISLAVNALSKQGAKRIWACATHGLFVDGANEVLANPKLEKIIITNSVEPFRLNKEILEEKVEVLDASTLFAHAIKQIAENGSIVDLKEGYPKQNK
ncbi:ribose-phosphate diphosphokinase [Legionella impletisoli]|uniref:ribose-phosphate diphosphokinase n=1 Tax=Legionella impletisoli TaxID=343510 RepID=A0A917JNS3_9GAMM|nr:ribose-phosphate pyrophosphokinase [Legionella impletisoli]GGI77399.1 ribose-phosphate pyrophosphokinase [Legionella impletisoli]